VLSDPEKRKKYDQYGKDWKNAEAFETAGQHQGHASRSTNRNAWNTDSANDFSDFFESIFGNQSNAGRKKLKGQDINASLNLDLRDVYKTQKQTLNVNGKNIRLTIPAGVENGQIIKIAGYGGPGYNGGPNGDLYIDFSIRNNTKFRREGNNLYTDVDIELYTALLGGECIVDTFDSKVKLKILPETQNGANVKLKGKGFPIYKKENEFGDLFITYHIKMPTHLSEQEKSLFKELSKIRHSNG
jgi:curved DNA-binding protein